MIRRLIARSIVVAGFAAIIGIFWHEYGIEALGIGVPVSFSTQTQTIEITGQFKRGPQATVHRAVAVDLDAVDVRALRFSPFNAVTGRGPRHKVYIDQDEVSEDTVVTAVQSLRFFIKKEKEGNSTYGAFPYELTLTDRKFVDAGQIVLSDSETLIRAVWTREEEGLWTLQVKGAPGNSGKAFIMASDILPVISKSSSALPSSRNPAPRKGLEPIPMVVYQDGRRRAVCLDFKLANEGYHVLPSRSDRFPLAELDLGGDSKKISMKFDVDIFKLETANRMNDSCGNPRATWSSLSDTEKLKTYRDRQLDSLETILWAQHETR
jgi:hypothetical protein